MTHDSLGLIAVLVVCFFALACIISSRLRPIVKVLLCGGLLLRLVGAYLYYIVALDYYGAADAIFYYDRGLEYAEHFARLDFSMIRDASQWYSDQPWNTQFIFIPSGIVLALIGPTLLGECIVFALMGFVGLLLLGTAFRRTAGAESYPLYLGLILLFPSLWFWPATVGKEAVILLGMGLAVYGIAGKQDRVSWPATTAGTFIVFAVRPQVGAIMIASALIALIIATHSGGHYMKLLYAVVLVIGGTWVVREALSFINISEVSLRGLQEYIDMTAARSITGGSSVGETAPGVQGAVMGVINVLFRPFIWEARNLVAVASTIEVYSFLGIAVIRRREIVSAFRQARSYRMVAFSIVFCMLYALLLGMIVANMGIIVRQRIFLYPFLFVLFAMPRAARRHTAKPEPELVAA